MKLPCAIQGEFAARLARKIMGQVPLAAVVFEEPVAGNSGPLVSPRTYREIALSSYAPSHCRSPRVRRGYDHPEELGERAPPAPGGGRGRFQLPVGVRAWGPEMDYWTIRQEFGSALRLIGGIDLDVLRIDKNAIREELERVVPPLLAQGGYIPMLDGRVRIDIPFENYTYYRRLLEEMVGAKEQSHA